MVLHMPWTRNLGGSRVQFELAEHLVSLGHVVEKFDLFDATPAWLRTALKASHWDRLLRLMTPKFTSAARRKILSARDRYDVIDAHQGNLPYSKASLAFPPAIICRSVGLLHLYSKFDAEAPTPDANSRRLLPLLVAQMERRRQLSISDVETSFRHADAIVLPNPTEADLVAEMGFTSNAAHVVPFGLPLVSLKALETAKTDLPNTPCVAFIGTWERRKGSSDWPSIVRGVRSHLPDTRFHLLGTGRAEEQIRSCFAPEDRYWVDVTPNYTSLDLPHLLAKSTVGAFPSYLEGFGYGVLEMIAAGLPVVSYNIPGPSLIISPDVTGALVPPGDTKAMSSELVRLLGRTTQAVATDASNCTARAAKFNIPEIAARTLEIYRAALAG